MVQISSLLVLLAGSLLAVATPIPDPFAVANPEPAALSNGEKIQRGLAVGPPKKLFDASKRNNAERAVASPSPPTFKTFVCGHGQSPLCCFKGVTPSDTTCFNAFSGTGGAATTAPFTCEAVNAKQPGATKGECYVNSNGNFKKATQV